MTSETHGLVDALPYFDRGYDEPGVKDAALALVEEELRRYKPTKNYLESLPSANYHLFETDVIKTEFERLQARQPMEMLSIKRYELPAPAAGRMNDVSAWQECVDNAQAQLEHQSQRIINLELMSLYGTEAWRMYNGILEKMVASSQSQLNDIRKRIQEINWQRKQEQMEAGAKLKQLEDSWVGLVGKNYEIERACVELEMEIDEEERRRGKL